jgi:hypothetical protein
VHRRNQALERRGGHPASWRWETAAGRPWFARLGVATLSLFGRKRGVGMDTMHAFVARLPRATQGGCAPSALRGVMPAWAAARLKTAGAWEQEGGAEGAERESLGAVDATFFAQMMLGLLDRQTGSVLLEAMAAERTSPPGQTLVDARLKALGTGGLSLVSDRAKARVHLAAQGLECFRRPDCFPLVPAIVKRSSLALGRRMRQAPTALREAREAWARLPGRPDAAQEAPAAPALVATRHAAVTPWEEAPHP